MTPRDVGDRARLEGIPLRDSAGLSPDFPHDRAESDEPKNLIPVKRRGTAGRER